MHGIGCSSHHTHRPRDRRARRPTARRGLARAAEASALDRGAIAWRVRTGRVAPGPSRRLRRRPPASGPTGAGCGRRCWPPAPSSAIAPRRRSGTSCRSPRHDRAHHDRPVPLDQDPARAPKHHAHRGRRHDPRGPPAHHALENDQGPPGRHHATPARAGPEPSRAPAEARPADLTTTPPGRRSKTLRQAVKALTDTGPTLTRSKLEISFLALIDTHGLPRPLVNAVVQGLEVDFFWPAHRLISRGRRRRHPPHPAGVRARPRARRPAPARRLPRRALHAPPGCRPTRRGRPHPVVPADARIRPSRVGFPSGQRGRAVNPLAQPSQVRILPPPSRPDDPAVPPATAGVLYSRRIDV